MLAPLIQRMYEEANLQIVNALLCKKEYIFQNLDQPLNLNQVKINL